MSKQQITKKKVNTGALTKNTVAKQQQQEVQKIDDVDNWFLQVISNNFKFVQQNMSKYINKVDKVSTDIEYEEVNTCEDLNKDTPNSSTITMYRRIQGLSAIHYALIYNNIRIFNLLFDYEYKQLTQKAIQINNIILAANSNILHIMFAVNQYKLMLAAIKQFKTINPKEFLPNIQQYNDNSQLPLDIFVLNCNQQTTKALKFLVLIKQISFMNNLTIEKIKQVNEQNQNNAIYKVDASQNNNIFCKIEYYQNFYLLQYIKNHFQSFSNKLQQLLGKNYYYYQNIKNLYKLSVKQLNDYEQANEQPTPFLYDLIIKYQDKLTLQQLTILNSQLQIKNAFQYEAEQIYFDSTMHNIEEIILDQFYFEEKLEEKTEVNDEDVESKKVKQSINLDLTLNQENNSDDSDDDNEYSDNKEENSNNESSTSLNTCQTDNQSNLEQHNQIESEDSEFIDVEYQSSQQDSNVDTLQFQSENNQFIEDKQINYQQKKQCGKHIKLNSNSIILQEQNDDNSEQQ